MMKSSKSGFTLAEVLTTLMIIGVIAALTIPTLINSTGDAQTKAQTKKATSVIAQAAQLLYAQEQTCSYGNSVKAGESSELATCFANVMSGTTDGNALTTADGTVYYFYGPAMKKGSYMLNNICGSATGKAYCGVIADVNGLKKGTTSQPTATYDTTNGGFTTYTDTTDLAAFDLSAGGVILDEKSSKAKEYLGVQKGTGTKSTEDKTTCDKDCQWNEDKNPVACECTTIDIDASANCTDAGYYNQNDSDATKCGERQ